MNEHEHRELLKQIASEITKSGWIFKQVYKLSSDRQLMDDLIQDILLSILTYPNHKLIDAYIKNEHLYFIKRIITNQYCSNNSLFYYTYRKNVGIDLEYVINLDDNRKNEC